jgi:hypothetical protein
MPRVHLEVDGLRYLLEYAGHEAPLTAWTDGEPLQLQPWHLGQHLAALGHAARVHDDRLELDPAAYAAHVLTHAIVRADDHPDPAALLARWGPLALWWAAAGHELPPPGYTLRPWTLLERAAAVHDALDPATASFSVGRYLGALLDRCVTGGPPPRALPMPRGAPLLAAAALLCAPLPLLPEAVDDPTLRRITLRLCTALGWSADQVWRTPAPEIDRLLALLDHETTRRPRPGLSALAAHPDTRTLEFD